MHSKITFRIYISEVDMPRDFKSFKNNQSKNAQNDKVQQNDKTSEYQEIIDRYKDMDNNELMSNLFSEASKLKREGKLDSNTLSNLKSSLSPFLNSEQQEMLSSLIRAIDDNK